MKHHETAICPVPYESIQGIIDTQHNLLCELNDRIELLGKTISPVRNIRPSEPCPDKPEPGTEGSPVAGELHKNNASIRMMIEAVNSLCAEVQL